MLIYSIHLNTFKSLLCVHYSEDISAYRKERKLQDVRSCENGTIANLHFVFSLLNDGTFIDRPKGQVKFSSFYEYIIHDKIKYGFTGNRINLK